MPLAFSVKPAMAEGKSVAVLLQGVAALPYSEVGKTLSEIPVLFSVFFFLPFACSSGYLMCLTWHSAPPLVSVVIAQLAASAYLHVHSDWGCYV